MNECPIRGALCIKDNCEWWREYDDGPGGQCIVHRICDLMEGLK